ncbi:integral membrane protein [Flexibacter flexilis DSM 6793]|uniref:Integral membrane protein n=1 Tax=Flexibacter flexilis DSM 6793 TaxID=927664 RepID=A0A1I1NIG4_9BACT|nr:DUF3817 domain-containing protein [Flexibacter flexilis]SFC97206.1 integral membrane protein [Flexibacter flexilis DSM 6793]
MKTLLSSNLGRLRLLGKLEGSSLLLLVFVAVPLKHLWNYPLLVQILGQIHGLLFVLFVLNTISVATEKRWVFSQTTWKVLLACIVPFGTFYIDKKILQSQESAQ